MCKVPYSSPRPRSVLWPACQMDRPPGPHIGTGVETCPGWCYQPSFPRVPFLPSFCHFLAQGSHETLIFLLRQGRHDIGFRLPCRISSLGSSNSKTLFGKASATTHCDSLRVGGAGRTIARSPKGTDVLLGLVSLYCQPIPQKPSRFAVATYPQPGVSSPPALLLPIPLPVTMRFVHTNTLSTRIFPSPPDASPFAILSRRGRKPPCGHTGRDACKTSAIPSESIRTSPFVQQACSVAKSHGVQFLCSFDEDMGSTDVGHHVIQDYSSWLRSSTFCMVFLDCDELEYQTLEETIWEKSTYWKDPWSLQELIFADLEFFDFSGKHLASKSNIISLLARISGIDEEILRDPNKLQTVPLGTRLSWPARHDTLEDVVPEDTAYALAAVVGTRMLVSYGEGAEKAFQRLQRELHKTTKDLSVLAWCNADDGPSDRLVARTPRDFQTFAKETRCAKADDPWRFDGSLTFKKEATEIRSRMIGGLRSRVLVEVCRRPRGAGQPDDCIGIYVQPRNGCYIRAKTQTLVRYSSFGGTFYTFALDCTGVSENRLEALDFNFVSEPTPRLLTLPTPGSCKLQSVLGTKRHFSDSIEPEQHSVFTGFPSNPLSTPIDGYATDDSDTISDCSWTYVDSVSDEAEYGLDSSHQYTTSTSYSSVMSSWHRASGRQQAETNGSSQRQQYLSSIVRTAYQDFCAGISSGQMRNGSDNEMLPPGKKARRGGQRPQAGGHIDAVDGPRQYFACPFYALSPDHHEKCLLEHGLKSIDQVLQHLARDHRRPPYCPRCRAVFDCDDERDEHIQLRICELRPINKIEGLGLSDVESLIQQDEDARNRGLGDEARWHRLVAFVDPASKARTTVSPYLYEGFGLMVSRLRAFWAERGHLYVEKPLHYSGLLDERVVDSEVLKILALQGLIDRLHDGREAGRRIWDKKVA